MLELLLVCTSEICKDATLPCPFFPRSLCRCPGLCPWVTSHLAASKAHLDIPSYDIWSWNPFLPFPSVAQGKWPYLSSWACASQSSLMGHLPAPGQPFSAGACSLLCETLTAHTFSIPLPCHMLSETTCCHSGPFTGQATTFPFCPLFLSLAPSHFSSSSLFSFNQALTHRTLQPLLNTSLSSFPHLYCFSFSSIGPWDAPLPTALPPTLCGHWMPLCPLSLLERF